MDHIISLNRRSFVFGIVSTAALTVAPRLAGAAPASRRFKAIAFDAFPILDPRPVFALVDELVGERGQALAASWKTKQFEYTWLRSLSGHYVDFWQVTHDALDFAARETRTELSSDQRSRLMNAYLHLKVWPDVVPALQRFRAAGLKIAFLSNFTPDMLAAAMRGNALSDLIEYPISTDRAKTFKPDPRAYQLGIDVLQCTREEILFVPFAAWDAAGAKWFGYPTYWVNRANQPLEILSAPPDGIGADLRELLAFVGA